MNPRPLALACLLSVPFLAACSGPPPATSASATSAPATSPPAAASSDEAVARAALASATQATKPTACTLVTPDEMSKIFGTALQGEPHEGSVDKTECIYKPADRVSPYIELTVEWGEGETAMNAMGAMSHAAPGVADPYAGIGDQAMAAGTALMIRSGHDLITITFSGVDDAPGKARTIFETLKPRL